MSFLGGEVQYLVARLILDTSGFDSALRGVTTKTTAASKALQTGLLAAGTTYKFLERSTLITAAAATALTAQFIKVQDAQAALARTMTGEGAPAIAKVNDQILELSKVIPLSVTELYRIAEVIGTTGIASDSIKGLTEVVAKLAATTDLSADEAAYAMARLLTIFGKVDKDGRIAAGAAEGLGSALTKASLDFASTDQNILRATLRFAALGKQMKLTEGQIIALAALGTGLGQEPEAFGGSMQRLLQIFLKYVGEYDNLTKKQKRALTDQDNFVKLSKIAGMSAAEFSKNLKTAPFEAITSFLDGLKELSATQQATLFGGDALFPSLVRGQQSIQNLTERIEKLKLAGTDLDSTFARGKFLDEVFVVRIDTLAKKFQLLFNALVRGSVAFGEGLDESLGGALANITKLIDQALPAFERFGKQVGDWIGSIDWRAAGEFAKTYFGILKSGFDIVAKLPKELLAVVLLMKTINGLTGGVVGKFGQMLVLSRLIGAAGGAAGAAGGAAVASTFAGRLAAAATGLAALAVNAVKLVGIFGGLYIVGTKLIESWEGFKTTVDKAHADLDAKVEASNLQSGGESARGAAALADLVKRNLEQEGPITGLLTQFGLGRDQLIAAFKSFAANIAGDPSLSPSSRRIAFEQLARLGDAIVQSGLTKGDRDQLRDRLDRILDSVQTYVQATNYGRTEVDLARQIMENTAATEAAATATEAAVIDLTKKWLDALKPQHREGERGKSIETTVGRKLQRLDIGDPNFAGKLTAYVGRLVDHYTKQPIGTKGHSRGFVLGNVDPVERSLARELRQAIKEGNVPAQDLLVRQLEALDSIPKNDLSPQIERLIETVRRKRLSVRVGGPKVVVTTPRAINRTNVSVTIGKRSIVRSVYSGGGYGPTYVYAGNPGLMYEGPN